MSQLSTVINKTVHEALKEDGFEPRKLASKVWEQLDDENRQACGLSEIIRRMKAAAKTITKDVFSLTGENQIQLPFQIDGVVSLDIESRTIRRTESLTLPEFKRAMTIRKKQVKDNRKSLRGYEQALKAMMPYWEKNPDWTLGQCAAALGEDLAKGADKAA